MSGGATQYGLSAPVSDVAKHRPRWAGGGAMTKQLASKILAGHVVRYEYISALDVLGRLTENFGWRVVIEAICQQRGAPDIWQTAEALRKAFDNVLEGKAVIEDSEIKLLSDTAWLVDLCWLPKAREGSDD